MPGNLDDLIEFREGELRKYWKGFGTLLEDLNTQMTVLIPSMESPAVDNIGISLLEHRK